MNSGSSVGPCGPNLRSLKRSPGGVRGSENPGALPPPRRAARARAERHPEGPPDPIPPGHPVPGPGGGFGRGPPSHPRDPPKPPPSQGPPSQGPPSQGPPGSDPPARTPQIRPPAPGPPRAPPRPRAPGRAPGRAGPENRGFRGPRGAYINRTYPGPETPQNRPPDPRTPGRPPAPGAPGRPRGGPRGPPRGDPRKPPFLALPHIQNVRDQGGYPPDPPNRPPDPRRPGAARGRPRRPRGRAPGRPGAGSWGAQNRGSPGPAPRPPQKGGFLGPPYILKCLTRGYFGGSRLGAPKWGWGVHFSAPGARPGGQKSAHFFGYLIILPVGTNRNSVFLAFLGQIRPWDIWARSGPRVLGAGSGQGGGYRPLSSRDRSGVLTQGGGEGLQPSPHPTRYSDASLSRPPTCREKRRPVPGLWSLRSLGVQGEMRA